ncbi:MAG: T9SS type A sorting domain-containing protein [Sphingobacteriaceae bacterium]|nr:T9SS type A sorting domain-containing protein [Sphingobacteriaceae bacterium]
MVDLSKLAPGIYYCKINSETKTTTLKLILEN